MGLDVKLHNTMSASVWAKEFMDIVNTKMVDIDEGFMIGWFANAIMTGWDHKAQQLEPKLEKLKGLILLTDPVVSDTVMGDTQIKQWNEYVNCFPDEAGLYEDDED